MNGDQATPTLEAAEQEAADRKSHGEEQKEVHEALQANEYGTTVAEQRAAIADERPGRGGVEQTELTTQSKTSDARKTMVRHVLGIL